MKDINNIIKLYFKTVEGFREIEKKPKDFGTGDLLYSSEIHTIEQIGNHSSINLTVLSEKLGISKSAVSKSIKKLLLKDLITKSRRLDNDKEVIYNLTVKGLIAFSGHEEFSKTTFQSIRNLLSELNDEQKNFMEMFLSDLALEINKINNL